MCLHCIFWKYLLIFCACIFWKYELIIHKRTPNFRLISQEPLNKQCGRWKKSITWKCDFYTVKVNESLTISNLTVFMNLLIVSIWFYIGVWIEFFGSLYVFSELLYWMNNLAWIAGSLLVISITPFACKRLRFNVAANGCIFY